jgi:hypothetical protein
MKPKFLDDRINDLVARLLVREHRNADAQLTSLLVRMAIAGYNMGRRDAQKKEKAVAEAARERYREMWAPGWFDNPAPTPSEPTVDSNEKGYVKSDE